MSSTELFLLVMSLVVAASVGVVFLLYKNELGRACEAARRGSLVANTDAGPIEYAQKGTGIPLLSIHGAGGGFENGWPGISRVGGGAPRSTAEESLLSLRCLAVQRSKNRRSAASSSSATTMST